MRKHRYTDEEKAYVMAHLREYETYRDFCAAFNARFACRVTPEQLRDLCVKRLKYPLGKNATRFKAGGRPRAIPIGSVRKGQNGATYIKVSDTSTDITGYAPPDWIPLQKKIWEDAYGPVPDGKMVCFLDRDRENFDIANLYCIDRKISAILAANGWWSENRDITMAAVKYAELLMILRKE